MQEVEQSTPKHSRTGTKIFPRPNLCNSHSTGNSQAADPTSNLQFWTAHPPQLSAHRFHLIHKWHQNGVIDPLGKKRVKIQGQKQQECLINPSAYTLQSSPSQSQSSLTETLKPTEEENNLI